MNQYVEKYPNFYPLEYQMIDFYKTGTELAKIYVPNLIKKGKTCIGVIVNTDTSEIGHVGKHWFCLFIDARHEPVTIEYFNSSGSNPMDVIHKRMREIAHDLRKAGKKSKVIASTLTEIQKDHSSCGVYSLIYIYSRLKEKPIDWFLKDHVGDMHMMEFRKRLFLNE